MNMKKERFLPRIIRTIVVLCFSLSAGRGQIFFIKNHAADPDETRFRFSPAGYTVLSLDGFPNFCLSQQELDLDGQELSWETHCAVLPEEDFVYWLRDDTVLVSNNTFIEDQLLLVKRTVDGDTLWSSSIPKSTQWLYTPMEARENAAGEIFILGLGKKLVPPVEYRLFAAKFSQEGQLQWNTFEPTPLGQEITKLFVEPTPDGGLAFTMFLTDGGGNTSVLLQKRDGSGNLLWSQTLPFNFSFQFGMDAANGITVSWGLTDQQTGYPQMYVQHFSDAGEQQWLLHLNTLFGLQKVTPSIKILVSDPAQGILVMGREGTDSGNYIPFLALLDFSGNLIWKRNYSVLNASLYTFIVGAAPTPDHGFILGGNSDQGIDDYLFVMKIDGEGNLLPGNLEGYVRLDDNDNCVADTSEAGLANWVVFASNGPDFYTTTNAQGYFSLGLPAGTQQVFVVPPSDLWSVCPNGVTVTVPDSGLTTLSQHFAAAPVVDCPVMRVSVSAPILRRCFPNNYFVNYCNDGTTTADSVVVVITLPDEMDFNSASIPFTLDSNTLVFQIGAVEALECSSFVFNVTPDCDETEIGQTLCVSASIYPDTLCNPPANWSGATLAGTANCLGDSVQFVLTNTGFGPSAAGLDFVVVDDHVIMMQEPLPSLSPQDQYTTTVPASGTTLRFLAEQEPNHPLSEPVSVGVEGCNGPVQPGVFLEFPNTDGRPATARDCHELVGSWDPNDKSAAPRGVGDAHYILPGTPLDYLIRFQNTGTDTAFTVVVRDTLDTWLDPRSVQVGAASHPFDYNITENGLLTFVFDQIALPDSNVNEAASHGFVQFRVEQKAGVPLGSVLQNRAGIYFDFNPPVITNTVWHTVDTGFLDIVSRVATPGAAENNLRIFPNPARGAFQIDAPCMPGDRVRLYNALGKMVYEQAATGPLTEVKTGLPAGVYMVEWRSGREVMGRAKLVRQ